MKQRKFRMKYIKGTGNLVTTDDNCSDLRICLQTTRGFFDLPKLKVIQAEGI